MAQQGEVSRTQSQSFSHNKQSASTFTGTLKECCDVLLQEFEKKPTNGSVAVPRSWVRRLAFVCIIRHINRVKEELRHPQSLDQLILETSFKRIEERMDEVFSYTRVPLNTSPGIFELKPLGPRNTCQLLARISQRIKDNPPRDRSNCRVKESQCLQALEKALRKSLLQEDLGGKTYGIPTEVTYEDLGKLVSAPTSTATQHSQTTAVHFPEAAAVQVSVATAKSKTPSPSAWLELVLRPGAGQVSEDSSSEEVVLTSPPKKRKERETESSNSMEGPAKKIKPAPKKAGTEAEASNDVTKKRSKTTEEKTKAMVLTLDGFSMTASTSCQHCKPGECRVAIYPEWFDSKKCEKCIRQKNGCSFAKPGVDTDGSSTESWRQNRDPYKGKTWQDIAKEHGLREKVLEKSISTTRREARGGL